MSAGRRSAAASALGAFPDAMVLAALERRAAVEKNRIVLATLKAHIRVLKGDAASTLRRISDKDAWASVEDSPLWAQEDCPPEALVQIFDNRAGVSTWRVDTEEEITRVIAAQAFVRSTINDFAYCLIDEAVLRRENIKIRNSPMKTIDREMGSRHVDIIELSGKQLVRLAQIINFEFEPKVKTRSEILAAAATYFSNGTFDRTFLFVGGSRGRSEQEIANAKNLLVNLWKKVEIDLRQPD